MKLENIQNNIFGFIKNGIKKYIMIYDIKLNNNIEIAAQELLDGNIIIYPTDTLYGFGVDATNTRAIAKLNKLKKREQVYSIILSSINMIEEYIDNNLIDNSIIKSFLPGPYTLIMNNNNNNNLSHLINLDLNTLGIRIPNYDFVLNLVNLIKRPIVTTSVNVHKNKPLNEKKKIVNEFPNIKMFFDNSINLGSKGSTILDLSHDTIKLLRQGDGAFPV